MPTESPASGAESPAAELSVDEIQLRAQGHKGELPRQFSAFATLALAFSITNSWLGYSGVFAYPLDAGRGPTVFWGLIVAGVACTMITAGLAEIASAFPSSGGQYHFAFMVSPPSIRAPVAFIMGWLSVLAWGLTTASAVIVVAQITSSVAAFNNPGYEPTQWQIYLMSALAIILCGTVACLLPKLLPLVNQSFFAFSLLGFVVSFVAVLAGSDTKQSGDVVFVEFINNTGWSDGTAFMVAVGTCMYSFLATDATTHIAEEVPNPGRHVPRVMMLTMAIGIFTSVCWAVAFMFSTNDLDDVVGSALPIFSVYHQALSSSAAASAFSIWLMWLYWGASIGCIATTGRLAWAFARDNGFPFSRFLAKVHPTLKMPVNATVVSVTFVVLYNLIYIGSTTAFNSIISMCILALNITYAIPQGIVLWYGRDKVLPKRQFNLGPIFGPFCNAFSCLWVTLYTVLFCLPVYYPPTVEDMNYVSVVLVGIVVAIAAFWFLGKRKTFVGPVRCVTCKVRVMANNAIEYSRQRRRARTGTRPLCRFGAGGGAEETFKQSPLVCSL
ncbi:putative amino acid permease [Lineolata rhizophorae]|uniref:Putative amino acid permease n=1 Tax=Lineolata rhizophorae TaxID=578093 RepID=A0A6A6NXR0_9PEZI|nr:putative amino acid permease [Lineolata rhizophorae]